MYASYYFSMTSSSSVLSSSTLPSLILFPATIGRIFGTLTMNDFFDLAISLCSSGSLDLLSSTNFVIFETGKVSLKSSQSEMYKTSLRRTSSETEKGLYSEQVPITATIDFLSSLFLAQKFTTFLVRYAFVKIPS